MSQDNKEIDLAVAIGPLSLKNPVMVASGTFGYGQEFCSLVDSSCLGAIVTKGISLSPTPGNPPPRIVETPAGMLNAIGLQNVGLETFITEKLPYLRQLNTKIIVNFFGTSIIEYQKLSQRLSELDGISGLEVNISCPNIKEGGICFGTEPSMAYKVVREVRKSTPLPLIVKLTPNVTDISIIAKSVEEAGADALSLTNTFTGMVVDVEKRRPVLANVTGGLSGPAIRPLSLRMVWETVQKVSTPVIGIGGVTNANDALQYLIVGAQAIQVGTALFVDPKTPLSIIEGIETYLRAKGYTTLQQIIGSLKIDAAEALL
jgi:dihydroorotate dehydrogenase (NAD+) catalytic subunit